MGFRLVQVLTCSPSPLSNARGGGADSPVRARTAALMVSTNDLAAAAESAGLLPASIAFKDLQTGAVAALDADRYLYPASMLKTPLAAVALALVERGETGLDRHFAVTDSNMTANDKASPFVPGYSGTLREIIEFAITRSDNVATNMLFDICGRERATTIAQNEFGLKNTGFYRKLSGSEPLIVDPLWDKIHRNAHSAADAAKLFELIATRKVPGAELLEEILSRQQWNEKLNKGLRRDDRFAHKTGDTDEVTHDGGILTTDSGNYILVVYTGLESTETNNARFGPFMGQIRALL